MDNAIEAIELKPREGYALTAYMVSDSDSTPYEADCYTLEDVEAWKRDDWFYGGVIVIAERDGVECGEASIWGTEFGHIAGSDRWLQDFIDEDYYIKSLISDALYGARGTQQPIPELATV